MPNPTPTPPATDTGAQAEPATVKGPAGEPGASEVVVSSTPVSLVQDKPKEYVAKGPIFINGVRAYNEGSPVSAEAVKRNNLQEFVKKA